MPNSNIRLRGDSAHNRISSYLRSHDTISNQASCNQTAGNVLDGLFGGQDGLQLMVKPGSSQSHLRSELRRSVAAGKVVIVTMSPDHYFTMCPAGVGEIRLYQSMQLRINNKQTNIYTAGEYMSATFCGAHSGKRSLDSVMLDLEALDSDNENWRRTAAVSLFAHGRLDGANIANIAAEAEKKKWQINRVTTKDMP